MLGAGRWWLGAAAIVLAVAAAATTPEAFGGLFRAGGRERLVLPEGLRVHEYLLWALAALVAAVYLAAHVVGSREGIARPRRRSPWRVVGVLLVIVLAVNLVAPLRDRLDDWLARDQATQQEPDAPTEDAAPRPEPSRLLGYAVAALMLLAIVGLAGILWLLLGRAPRHSPPPPDDDIGAVVERGLADLRTIADPRAAVLACYARLQMAADRAGINRRTSDAPRELLQRLLDDGRADPPGARRLTELFELARFSPHTIDDSMRAEAVSALTSLRTRLDAQP